MRGIAPAVESSEITAPKHGFRPLTWDECSGLKPHLVWDEYLGLNPFMLQFFVAQE